MSEPFDPRNYTIEDAFNDILVNENGPNNVVFTESGGIMKEYDSKVQYMEPADNDKLHVTGDARYDSDGNLTSFTPHRNN